MEKAKAFMAKTEVEIKLETEIESLLNLIQPKVDL